MRWMLLVLFSFVGCSTADPVWREVELPVPFEDAWNEFERLTVQAGFLKDLQYTDRGRRIYQSRWKTRALAFRRSSRKRIHANFLRGEEGWTVEYYVENQRIADFARSFNPKDDDWEPAGQDPDLERLIAAQLRMSSGLPIEADK